ncbi:MAG TPA: glycosyltransferase family 39 protein [Thermoanaerobaculia bacterium]
MSRREKLWLAVLALTSVVMRAVAFFRYRFDSDEPQHLHVAWGWTAGLVQYRDLFDNHTPLFHIVTSFILRAFGERPDILLVMRAPMVVLWAAVLGATYVLAKRLYDARVAAWSVMLLAVFPPFFLKTLEYRIDNLWTALWMGALVVLLREPGRRPGAGALFAFGLLLGAALATSIKTSLLVITIVGVAVVAYGFAWLRHAIPALVGFALVPGALALYFMKEEAWDELVYCVFTFNAALSHTQLWTWAGRIAWPFVMVAIYVIARRRQFSLLAVGILIFVATLTLLWPLISPRDFLAIMPLAAILVVAHAPRKVVIGAAGLALISLIYYANRFENRTDEHITMMRQVLRLTRPGEPVMDIKGETIYRRRPHYHAFEVITREQFRRGMLRDTIAEDVVRARCHVAQADGPMFPPRGRAFLRAHFLDLGRLRASGQALQRDGSFTIAVPGEYVILNEGGEARGTLDGSAYSGARELTPGAHRFVSVKPEEALAVLWAPAYRRGHTPFHLRDREF